MRGVKGTVTHGASAYRGGYCRCDYCTAASTEAARTERAARYARRVIGSNGRWLAVTLGLPHGERPTYSNHGCRCDPCIAANLAKTVEYRRKRRERRAAA